MKYLLAIIFLFSDFSQNTKGFIYWSENTKLEWKDFKGIPDAQIASEAAVTNSGIIGRLQTKNDSATIIYRCFFDPSASWVKKGSETPELLRHEQLHFDIHELRARTAKKILKEKGPFKRSTFSAEFAALEKEMVNKFVIYQNQYDQETEHSRIADKQKEWEAKVALELKALSAFRDSAVKVQLIN